MAGREKTRADDERELDMLAQRCAGMKSTKLAQRYDLTPPAVRTLTNRIRDAHAAHTGEAVDGWW